MHTSRGAAEVGVLLDYGFGLIGAMGLGASIGGAVYAILRGLEWLVARG